MRRYEQRGRGEQSGGEQESERGNDEDVDEQSRCGDAMKVDSHGQRHGQLDGGGDEAEVEEQQAPVNGAGRAHSARDVCGASGG